MEERKGEGAGAEREDMYVGGGKEEWGVGARRGSGGREEAQGRWVGREVKGEGFTGTDRWKTSVVRSRGDAKESARTSEATSAPRIGRQTH